MSEAHRIYLHPRLLARRAAEIAWSQRARIELDARGRAFIPAADPLAEPEGERDRGARTHSGQPSPDPLHEPGRFEWLIRVLRALGVRPRAR